MSDWTEGKDFSGQTIRNITFKDAKIVAADLRNARFSGEIGGLTINDVEVGPLIAAELNRRYPERSMLRPDNVDGSKATLAMLEKQLAATYDRAGGLTEAQQNESVDDEWSCIESLRHIIFVVDAWLSGTIKGETDPYDPISLPPSFLPPKPPGTSIDPDAAPSLDETWSVLQSRLGSLRAYVERLNPDELLRPIEGHARSVQNSLWVIFGELWAHNRFINRDLDVVER